MTIEVIDFNTKSNKIIDNISDQCINYDREF